MAKGKKRGLENARYEEFAVLGRATLRLRAMPGTSDALLGQALRPTPDGEHFEQIEFDEVVRLALDGKPDEIIFAIVHPHDLASMADFLKDRGISLN